MTWTLQRIEEPREGLWPKWREIMSNANGVRIEPLFQSLVGHATVFRYSNRDFDIEFHARGSAENRVDYGADWGARADIALGPAYRVWIDRRPIKSDDTWPLASLESIKKKSLIS